MLHPQPGQVSLTHMYDVVPALFLNPAMLEMGLRVDSPPVLRAFLTRRVDALAAG